MPFSKRKIAFKRIYLLITFVAILTVGYTIVFLHHEINHKTPLGQYEELISSGKDFSIAFQDDLPAIIDETGVEGAIQVLLIGENNGLINLQNCHPLLHLVGHEAKRREIQEIERLIQTYGVRCQKAFQHGIEAQIVLEENNIDDMSESLTRACRRFQKYNEGSTCYHGAGHAFYQRTDDPAKAVKLCDAIKDDHQESIDDCYRGIFSEFGNQVVGIDGETGLLIPGPRKQLEDNTRPLLHCMKYEERYQEACMSQLTKVAFNQAGPGYDYSPCLLSEYNTLAKTTCVKIFAAVLARSELTDKNTLQVPQSILELSDDFQKAYILGLLDTLIGYKIDDIDKDWESICNQFGVNTNEYCRKRFSESLESM